MKNIGFVSTGDKEKDEKLAKDFFTHDERISAGMCPNGCGGMLEIDSHNAECPRCKFKYFASGGLKFDRGVPQ